MSNAGTMVGGRGQDNTASNVGGETGEVFKQKTGFDLEMKTIKAGTGISIVNNASDVEIVNTGSGETNTASNVGTGQGIFKQKTGVDLEFHELLAGSANIAIALVSDDVTIDLSANPSVTTMTTSGLNTAASQVVTGATDLQGTVTLSADITPTQITGDEVDYNPAGLSTTTILRLSSDITRTISGIAGGTDGRTLILFNVGSQDINLSHDDGASTAANRFFIDNDDTDEINQNGFRIVIYDATSSRWRVAGSQGASAGTGNVNSSGTLTSDKIVVGQGSMDVATSGITVTGSDMSSLDTATFATGISPSHSEGQLFYDDTCGALAFHNFETEVTMQVGQENWLFVRNNTGSTVTNGQAVYVSGAISSLPTVALGQADVVATSLIVGMATHDIENNTNGFITTQGIVNDVNTNAFVAGDILWLDAVTPGAVTDVKPSEPNIPIAVGVVLVKAVSTGKIYINPRVGVVGLQGVYDQSDNGDIVLTSGVGGISIQDASSPIGGNLFGVHTNAEAADLFTVTAAQVDTGIPVEHANIPKWTIDAITGAQTAVAETYHTLANSGGGDYTVTLPAAGNAGDRIAFKGLAALTEVVTIDGDGTETINGALSYAMTSTNYLLVEDDGVNWTIIDREGLIYVSADSDAGQSVTANVTDLIYEDNIVDLFGTWTGTDTFTAPRKGVYGIVAATAMDDASRNSISIYLDTVFNKFGVGSALGTAAITSIIYPLEMDVGESITIRYSGTKTRDTFEGKNYIAIREME